MLKRILIGLGAIVVVLAGAAFLLPREISVSRAITIHVEPDIVFAQINDLKAQNTWTVWALSDPSMIVTYSGPASGVGMISTWVSEEEGSGSQEIIESAANERVKTALNFGAMGIATGTFTLARAEGGTRVTWTLDTDMGFNPLMRWMGLFMDTMIGADFETGLLNLKAKLEGGMQARAGEQNIEGPVPSVGAVLVQELLPPPPALPETSETSNPADAPRVLMLEPRPVAYARGSVKFDQNSTPAMVQANVRATYERIEAVMLAQGLRKDGNMMIISFSQDPARWDYAVAVPIAAIPAGAAPIEGVEFGPSPAGKVVMAVHRGAYERIPATRERIAVFIASEGLNATKLMWEEHLTSPTDTAPEYPVTNVYQGLQ